MPADPPPSSDHAPQKRIGKGMIYAAWLLILVLITLGFSNWLDRQRNPNQEVRSTRSDGVAEITLARNRYGHYLISGNINGQAVEFMLDTGATVVAVPAAVAQRLGLERGPAVQVQTANGMATAYATRLDILQLGDIRLSNVRAHINPGMQGEEILLGMSVLKNLDFSQRGDMLTLRQTTITD
jgi:aspartyl protease family protein